MGWLDGILGVNRSNSRRLSGAAEGQIGVLRDTGNTYRQMANQQQGRYDTYRPKADAALTRASDLLTRRMTGEDMAQGMAQSLKGVADNYQAGQSALTAAMRARGISPNSASGIGGLSALESFRAGAQANAANTAYQVGQDRQLQGANALYQMLFGEANSAQGNAANYLGQAGSFAGQAAQGYGNMAQQAAAQEQAQAQQILGLIGAGASAFGTSMGQRMPTALTYTPGQTPLSAQVYRPAGPLPGVDSNFQFQNSGVSLTPDEINAVYAKLPPPNTRIPFTYPLGGRQ